MASGKTLTEIAKELSLSDKTVSTYRARLMEKLNLKSNADLMRYPLSTGVWPNGLSCGLSYRSRRSGL
jgi:DNA-binding NarL/FixJ family response regulator